MLHTLRRIRIWARHWPLWGVLLCGALNTLVWQWGAVLLPNLTWLLIFLCLIAVAAGIATPEKPTYTAAVLALGSPFPFGHVLAPIGLLPLYAIVGLGENILCMQSVAEQLAGMSIAAGLLLYGFFFLYGPYCILVYLGARLKLLLAAIRSRPVGLLQTLRRAEPEHSLNKHL